jgi:hypothetical protein
MVLYVAAFETENEALEATLSNIPNGWTVDTVIGETPSDVLNRMGFEAGDVRQMTT